MDLLQSLKNAWMVNKKMLSSAMTNAELDMMASVQFAGENAQLAMLNAQPSVLKKELELARAMSSKLSLMV